MTQTMRSRARRAHPLSAGHGLSQGPMLWGASRLGFTVFVTRTLMVRFILLRACVMAAILVAWISAGWLMAHVGQAAVFGSVVAAALLGAVAVRWVTAEGRVYWLVRWFFRQVSFGYLRMDVQGLPQISSRGVAIIAGNHPNVLDGLFLLVVSPRPVRFLIAEDMYTHRYLHGLFKALGMIPVYRTKSHNGDALRGAIAALQRGELLGIFPEGTTHFRGAIQEVKKGVGLLALRTGCPVVPLAIQGSDEAFPQGARFPRPRTIRMRFEEAVRYPPTDAHPIPEAQLAEVLEDIRRHILQTMQRVDAAPSRRLMPAWLKELQIALSALIVVPLSSFLTRTANPSLDPNEGR